MKKNAVAEKPARAATLKPLPKPDPKKLRAWLDGFPDIGEDEEVSAALTLTLRYWEWKVLAQGARARGQTLDQVVRSFLGYDTLTNFENDKYRTQWEQDMTEREQAKKGKAA
jgi:hypothetical protein